MDNTNDRRSELEKAAFNHSYSTFRKVGRLKGGNE
jgi:hypothetical protein